MFLWRSLGKRKADMPRRSPTKGLGVFGVAAREIGEMRGGQGLVAAKKSKRIRILNQRFVAMSATFIEAGRLCCTGALKPDCASMSEYSAKV